MHTVTTNMPAGWVVKTDRPAAEQIRRQREAAWNEQGFSTDFTTRIIHTYNVRWAGGVGVGDSGMLKGDYKLWYQSGSGWKPGSDICPVTLGNWVNLACLFHEMRIKLPSLPNSRIFGKVKWNYACKVPVGVPSTKRLSTVRSHIRKQWHHKRSLTVFRASYNLSQKVRGWLLPGKDLKLLKVFQRCHVSQEWLVIS